VVVVKIVGIAVATAVVTSLSALVTPLSTLVTSETRLVVGRFPTTLVASLTILDSPLVRPPGNPPSVS